MNNAAMPTEHLPSLVAALGAVVSEYRTFMATHAPEDPKMFAARHAAGKAAVGHAAVILKLLQCFHAAGTTPDAEADRPLDEMLAAARAALSQYDDGAENGG